LKEIKRENSSADLLNSPHSSDIAFPGRFLHPESQTAAFIFRSGAPMMYKNVRILILEDSPSDADLIEFALQEEGISFISKRVETERDYIRELQGFSPDIILSDYNLPQYTGSLALDAAKKLCSEVPFILVTGALSADNGQCREIVSNGAKDCVMKNQLEQLAPAVRKALGAINNSNTVTKRVS
jgi:CheY-like chemotaxis protein